MINILSISIKTGVTLAISGLAMLAIIGLAVGMLGMILRIRGAVIAKKNRNPDIVNNVKENDGVRYTTNKAVETEYGDVLVSHREKDIILERGVTYTVSRKGAIIPGKYAVLSVDNNVSKFNVRMGGLVREMEHCGNIVLADGEEIAAVSHSLILR